MKTMKLRVLIALSILAIVLNAYSLIWWHKHLKEDERDSTVQLMNDPKSMAESDATFDEDTELSKSLNYVNAANAFKRKDYVAAISELNSDLEKAPNHAQSFFLLGKIYEVATFPNGKYLSKMAYNYQKYIDLKPKGYRADYAKLKTAQYFISVGLMQQNTELLDKAEQYLKSLDQNSNEVRMALGAIYLDKKNFNQAISEFEKSANLQPNELRLKYNSLGLAYIKTGKYGNAETVLKLATQIEPENKFAHNNLGFTYLRLKNFEGAKLEFQEALKIDPNYKNAQDNLDWLNSPYAK